MASSNSFISYYEEKNLADEYYDHRPMYPPHVAEAITSHMRKLHSANEDKRTFDKMIDVGCGSGQATQIFSPYFDMILGLDISAEQLEVARGRNKNKNIQFAQVKDNVLPVEDSSVDLITCATAAHWFDIEHLVGQCERVLKRNGCAAFFVYFAESMQLDGKSPAANQSELDLQFQDMVWDFVLAFEGHPRNEMWARKYRPIFDQIPNSGKHWLPGIEFLDKRTLFGWRKFWTTKGDYVQYMQKKKPETNPLDAFIGKLKQFLGVPDVNEKDINICIRWVVPTIIFSKP